MEGRLRAHSRRTAALYDSRLLDEMKDVESKLPMPLRIMGEGSRGRFRSHHSQIIEHIAMHRVRKIQIHHIARKIRAVISHHTIAIPIYQSIHPLYKLFILLARCVYSEDVDI